MLQLPEDSVSSWVPDGPRSHPSLVDWYCPHCSRLASFTAISWRDIGGDNWHSTAKCPGCKGKVELFTLSVGTGQNSLCGGKLFMYPASRTKTPSSAVLQNVELSLPLKNAYKSAVNVFNTREWNASAVMCRRLLEGITKEALPASAQKLTLAKQLESLPKHRDLAKPLVELADAVRKGGNLGAHFDLEKEPDEDVAALMLELCEDLMEYLFTLPVRIEDLHRRIEALATKEHSEDED